MLNYCSKEMPKPLIMDYTWTKTKDSHVPQTLETRKWWTEQHKVWCDWFEYLDKNKDGLRDKDDGHLCKLSEKFESLIGGPGTWSDSAKVSTIDWINSYDEFEKFIGNM